MLTASRVRVTRAVCFSAAHRYHNAALSAEENERLFGECNRAHGHGHNYRVEVTVEGAIDPITGMVVNLSDLDRLLQEQVVDHLDHTFLNYDVPHFEKAVPTCENVAAYLVDRLAEPVGRLSEGSLVQVRVWESDDLYAEAEVVTP